MPRSREQTRAKLWIDMTALVALLSMAWRRNLRSEVSRWELLEQWQEVMAAKWRQWACRCILEVELLGWVRAEEVLYGVAWNEERTSPGMGTFQGGQDLRRKHDELFQRVNFMLFLEQPHASVK